MRSIVISIFSVLSFSAALAQCDEAAATCEQYIPDGFISDGQSYRALLVDEETAEFRTTFFSGTIYRLAACGGEEAGNIVFRVLDVKRNLLFTNEDYDLNPYWNFKAQATQDVLIEARLREPDGSGCAVLLVSFER